MVRSVTPTQVFVYIATLSCISNVHRSINGGKSNKNSIPAAVHSFSINPSIQYPQIQHRHSRSPVPSVTGSTICYGRKRGKLTQNVSPSPSKSKSRPKGSSDGKKGGNGSGSGKKKEVAISSSLADWAASSSSSTSTTPAPAATTTTTTSDDDKATTYQPFSTTKPKPTSPRRERQALRQKLSSERRAALLARTAALRDLLEETDLSVPTLLSTVQEIIREFGGEEGDGKERAASVRRFLQGRTDTSRDYTLAWVGSDEAICHVGTGLHKVPLARLQDIFLTVGKVGLKAGGWRMMEVIRILGPFPNVRNTLLGSVVDVDARGGGEEGTGVRIRYDSIVDGVGKELNAGKEEEERNVELDVLFVDEEMILCVVPGEEGKGVKGDGTNVLLFLAEDELEEKLELARVAG